VFRRIQYHGIFTAPSASNRAYRTAVVSRDSVTCRTASSGTGIEVDYAPARLKSNVVRGCNYGIALYGDTTTVSVSVDSNSVSGGYYGVYLYYPSTATVSGTRNRIANNSYAGIYDASFTLGTRAFTGGAIYNNTYYGIYRSVGVSPPIFTATDNWWGSPSGTTVGGPNGVSSAVDYSSPKASDPTDVPGLVSPIFASAGGPSVFAASPIASAGQKVKPAQQPEPPQIDPQLAQQRAATFAEIEARDRAMREDHARTARVGTAKKGRVARQ
jgi:hypothetical protein